MKYAVVIEKGPTSYGAYVPDLPGCVAVAKTVGEVKKLIAEAIALHIEELRRDGQVVRHAGEAAGRDVDDDEVGAVERRSLVARRPHRQWDAEDLCDVLDVGLHPRQSRGVDVLQHDRRTP